MRISGVLISSTACIGDRQAYLKPILWLAGAVGAIPRVQVFTSDALQGMFATAGFKVVEEWQHGSSVVSFTVLRRD